MKHKLHLLVQRIAMCGGGTAYDVYVQQSCKRYYPITGHIYETVIINEGIAYLNVSGFLRTKAVDELPALTQERMAAFRRIERLAKRLEYHFARQVFPELSRIGKMPFLWASWDMGDSRKEVTVELNERNFTKYCD